MITLRDVAPEDAAALARIVADGFASYRSFAPPGWQPPDGDSAAGVDAWMRRMEAPDAWGQVAVHDGVVAGVVAVEPARDGEPQVAHLFSCFVAEPWWGTGTATALLHAAFGAARAAGVRRMRLFCAAGHARALRFYTREGFVVAGPPAFEPALGLDIVRMHRDLAHR